MVALGRNISTPENILKLPHKLFSDFQNLISENFGKNQKNRRISKTTRICADIFGGNICNP